MTVNRNLPRLEASWLVLGILALIGVMIHALTYGASSISSSQVVKILLLMDQDSIQANIIWQVRLPRVCMAAMTGAGLAVVGASIQALVRNPMADPWLLGVSSGASLGAVLVIVAGVQVFGGISLQLMAFLGALGASFLVYRLAQRRGIIDQSRLILLGIAVSFALSALTQLLIFSARHASQVRGVLFWTMGSFAGVELSDLPLPALTLFFSSLFLFHKRYEINLLTLSDAKAYSLGINLKRFRKQLFLVTAALTSVLVALTGAIGFVGLMIPHLLRRVVGGHYRVLLPACLIYGACFLVLADTLSRWLFAPEELPVGVFTALLGSPIFIWLMWRSSHD
ncbi:MAG: FecCD family ABC transporter permease [Oligoflexus sp.]